MMISNWFGDPQTRIQKKLHKLSRQLQDLEVGHDNLMDTQEAQIDQLTEKRVHSLAEKRKASRMRQSIEKMLHDDT